MLTPELMARVKQLQLRSKRAVNEVFAGEYVSAFKGRGMEFSEVRAYQPGDDVRLIDWNVTARAGEPFVKRYIEERELTVLLVVDISASASFGSVVREKRETAAELGALLTMTALRANDKVGLLSFDREVRTFVPPRKGQNHGLRVIRELLEPGDADDRSEREERLRRLFRGGGGDERSSDAASRFGPIAALEHVARFLKKRAIIVLISDFMYDDLPDAQAERATRRRNDADDGSASAAENGRRSAPDDGGTRRDLESVLKLLRRRNDLILARVSDPREEDVPAVGLVEFVDLETGEPRWLDTSSRRVRRQIKAKALERAGADLLDVRTGRTYINSLLELFHQRERRRAR